MGVIRAKVEGGAVSTAVGEREEGPSAGQVPYRWAAGAVHTSGD